MADIIDTLHPKSNPSDNLYPNVKKENLPDDIKDHFEDDKIKVVTYDKLVDAEGHVIGMSAEEKNKLAKSLVIPTPTITSTELVGVNPSKEQSRVSIGEGLTIQNNVLKSTGGSGGTKLYKHYFNNYEGADIYMITTNATPFEDGYTFFEEMNSERFIRGRHWDGGMITGVSVPSSIYYILDGQLRTDSGLSGWASEFDGDIVTEL